MRKNFECRIIVSLALIFLFGCSNIASSSMEEKFKTVVPIADTNRSLEIKPLEDQNTFALGSDVAIRVENKSSQFIFFDYEGNYIKLFAPKDGEWVEVKNGLTYSGSRVLHPKGHPLLNLDATWARPEFNSDLLKDNKTDILVRIVLTGEIMRNDIRTGELVDAYMDVYVSKSASVDAAK